MLRMMRHGFRSTIVVWTLTTGITPAQAPVAAPAFEVASIKPSPPLDLAKIVAGKVHVGMNADPARVDIGSLSLADLIRVAYKLKPHQLIGPDWMSDQQFDIMAKMPEGANEDQVPGMLQALLVERFKLTFHRDSKEQSIYALVVGKNGHKMKESPPDPVAAADGDAPAERAGKGVGLTKVSMGESGMIRMEFSKMNMNLLADMLSRLADRPIVDMTDLRGNFQVAIEFSTSAAMNVARASGMGMMGPGGMGSGGDASRAAGDVASTPSSSVFSAVAQLGLKLEARKTPIEMIIVDHLEKMPTEN